MKQHPLWKPKFIQSAFVQASGFIGLCAHLLDGATYLALSAIALGIYSAAAVAENRLMK